MAKVNIKYHAINLSIRICIAVAVMLLADAVFSLQGLTRATVFIVTLAIAALIGNTIARQWK